MGRKRSNITALTGAVIISASMVALAGCGDPKPDFSKNEGAVAWLAHHNGTIPQACISQMVEKYGASSQIDEAARQKAQADAMEIAGKTYSISLASERLIAAREKVLEITREGLAQGYETESGVRDATRSLNTAISDWQMSRTNLAGLDACKFTATDGAFGFKYRPQVPYD